jgi:hypothetical protein
VSSKRSYQIPKEELLLIPGLRKYAKPRRFSAKFPTRRLATHADVRKKIEDWHQAKTLPDFKPHDVKFSARKFSVQDLKKIRRVHEAEMGNYAMIEQEIRKEDLFATLYTALTIREFNRIRDEYSKRSKRARTRAERKQINDQWEKHTKAAIAILDKAGLKRLKLTTMKSLVSVLKKDRASFKTIDSIAKTAATVQTFDKIEDAVAVNVGQILTVVQGIVLPSDVIQTFADLCENPVEGQIKKCFSRSFSLSVRLKVWCPTWTNPFRTCWKTFTIAGVSFTLCIDIGYRVDCRGFTAWGCGYAQACATLLGITFCASCSACVTASAAAGVASSAGDCLYGAGASAEIRCYLWGIPVFYCGVGLGLQIHAPCI